MTEADWDACADPTPMLAFLRGKASDRRLRLFAVACCRRIWHLLRDDRSRHGLETLEQSCDGVISPENLTLAAALTSAAYADASTAVESADARSSPLALRLRLLAYHYAAEAVDRSFRSASQFI